MNISLPDKPSVDGLEEKWINAWQDSSAYFFLEDSQKEVYSIDTPPPTVSGSLHIGHVFSYTHTDIIARYKRMQGYNVFYPMGWDDNGLPTERRVQAFYNVICDPLLKYTGGLETQDSGEISINKLAEYKSDKENKKPPTPVSRKAFIELCKKLTIVDEQQFKKLWVELGISVDWKWTYQTIDNQAQSTCQKVFLENLQNNEAYQDFAPTLWDISFQTAVAQAELIDRQEQGEYHSLIFKAHKDNTNLIIDTTRPELLPACIALVAHPTDTRYKHLFNSEASTPLFNVKVPILPHKLAQKDKGTGIAMVCTFGDITDVQWWRELRYNNKALPNRTIIGKNGRVLPSPPQAILDAQTEKEYKKLENLTVFSAKKTIVQMLKEANLMVGEPKPITHPVKFYEKGNKPLEIISTRQWYIKNGATTPELKKKLLQLGKKLNWTPKFMETRYADWVNGLTTDWLISRQRYFGVPIPLWYKLDENCNIQYDNPILPSFKQLPVDPQVDIPNGYKECNREKANGFIAEKDIMDTWATSSLTPQIVSNWLLNKENGLYNKVFPFSLRPQAQDIIRTWLFSTVLRSNQLNSSLPWANAAISGFILDPSRKKMGKSTGNATVPNDYLQEFGSDGVRYWSAKSRLGVDAILDTEQMKIGRRLAIKLLNATRFALIMVQGFEKANLMFSNEGFVDDSFFQNLVNEKIVNPLDIAVLERLNKVIDLATKSLDDYNHAGALDEIEKFFWYFCDVYIELIKDRVKLDSNTKDFNQANSAKACLLIVLNNLHRLLGPYLPFTTEEVWSWWRVLTQKQDNYKSIHNNPWSKQLNLENLLTKFKSDNLSEIPELTQVVLGIIRKYKTNNQLSMKADINCGTLFLPNNKHDLFNLIKQDVQNACHINDFNISSLDKNQLKINENDKSSVQDEHTKITFCVPK